MAERITVELPFFMTFCPKIRLSYVNAAYDRKPIKSNIPKLNKVVLPVLFCPLESKVFGKKQRSERNK